MLGRRWVTALLWAALLSGCGVPLGGIGKIPSTQLEPTEAASLSGLGDDAFSPRLVLAPSVSTGEQDSGPQGTAGTPRGVAGATRLGEAFPVRFSAGTGVQILAAGPERTDIVVSFSIDGAAQRIDEDPLAPNYTVETFVFSAKRDLTVVFYADDYDGAMAAGRVRWYVWQLPSSNGRVSSAHESAGPAGVTTLPGTFTFDAVDRGQIAELVVAGPVGSNLVLDLDVGEDRYRIDQDPRAPDLTVEGLRIEIDDPVTVTVRVVDAGGGALSGQVRWGVVKLPFTRTPLESTRRR